LTLLGVFLVAFVAVYAFRAVREGRGVFDFFKPTREAASATRPEVFTLPQAPPLELEDVELLSRLNNEYARLTRAVVPSVVSIDTAGVRTVRQLDAWGQPRLRQLPVQEQGSGVIVTIEGHVVTNYHVIADKQQLQVTLHDGKSYPATLIGEDRVLDIAVLKIEGEGPFTPLMFGDSDKAQVGQLVFAVGNPFGLGETVTQGILSARDRSLSDTQRDLLQTDAAINPGNSGGPLVSLRGEIIGINVAIFAPDRANPGFQGVGFSIPANDVKDSLLAILESGRPVRGFLGVGVEDLTPAWRSRLGFQGAAGAVVAMVAGDSPAEASGLALNDVILTFNGEPVRGSRHLLGLVQRTRAGTPVDLGIWRAGNEMTLRAVIAEAATKATTAAPPETTATAPPSPQAREQILSAIGVNVRDLSMEERLRGYRGVVVTTVSPDGSASEVMQPGDLIVGVNQQPIPGQREFYDMLATSAASQATVLWIRRAGQNFRVNVPAVGQPLGNPNN
jgi:S1-C subfamily serine protease